MKTINKKAILGMLVAIVMSLGVLQGINLNKQSENANLQQVGACIHQYGQCRETSRYDYAAYAWAAGGFATMAGTGWTGVGFCVGAGMVL
jgi:hypothetical protein